MASQAPAPEAEDRLPDFTGWPPTDWEPAAPGTARRGWATPPWARQGNQSNDEGRPPGNGKAPYAHHARPGGNGGHGGNGGNGGALNGDRTANGARTRPEEHSRYADPGPPHRPTGRTGITTLTARTAVPPMFTGVRTSLLERPPTEAPPPPPPPAPVAPPETARPAPTGKLPYNPALDGMRGLAVAAVLLFHGEFEWARGGYLGVSTFFTLSGFLITSLLVGERLHTGRVALMAFWARRLRRLLPASALTLGLVSLSALLTAEVWERELRGDVIGAVANVANWRFLLSDASYAERFASPSPVLHFWSLAIEEQFYWVFPLLAAGVLGLAKGSLRVFGGVLLALLGVSAALTLVYSDSPDTVYYATPIRMGEILVGALLALVVARGRIVGSRRLAPVAAVGGVAALALTVWAWWNIEEATPVLYDGGLLIYAGVSGLLVLAACVPGPVRWLLALPPLRLLGVISYGVYLFHWPIFLILDEDRADQWLSPLDLHPRGFGLFLVRMVPTLLLAVLSYRWLERPIRRGRRPRRASAPLLAGGAVTTVVALAVVVPLVSPPPADPFREFLAAAEGPDPDSLAAGTPIGVTLGDSTMLMTAWGLSSWGADTGRMVIPGGAASVGCGIGRGGSVAYAGGQGELEDGCEQWADRMRAEITRVRDRYGHVDFAVVQTGPWDVADRRLEGEDEWRHIGDPVYDRYLEQELEAANDLLIGEGLTVIWLTAPTIEAGRSENPPPEDPYPESEPERMQRLNGLITRLAAEREGVVVVDLAAFIAAQPTSEDDRLRPDGVHFTEETSIEVASAWLGEQVVAATTREPLPEPEPAPGEPEQGSAPTSASQPEPTAP